MKLRELEGKTVVVELNNNKSYEGKVIDFIFAEDNNPPKNSLLINTIDFDNLIEVYEDDIKSIEVI